MLVAMRRLRLALVRAPLSAVISHRGAAASPSGRRAAFLVAVVGLVLA
jgi:hypothetical protein